EIKRKRDMLLISSFYRNVTGLSASIASLELSIGLMSSLNRRDDLVSPNALRGMPTPLTALVPSLLLESTPITKQSSALHVCSQMLAIRQALDSPARPRICEPI